MYGYFKVIFYIHDHDRWYLSQQVPLKRQYTSTRLHSVTSQKTATLIFNAVDTSNVLWTPFTISSLPHVRDWHSENSKMKYPTPSIRPNFLLLQWRLGDYFSTSGSVIHLYVNWVLALLVTTLSCHRTNIIKSFLSMGMFMQRRKTLEVAELTHQTLYFFMYPNSG